MAATDKGMSSRQTIEENKKVVFKLIPMGLLFGACFFFGGFYFFPFKFTVMDTVSDRLHFTLRWQLFSVFMVLMAVHGVGQKRSGSSAMDPIKGNAEHLVQVQKNILQNTVEQYILHLIGQIVLCSYLSSDSMKAIPLLVSLFVIGRITYRIGYTRAPMQRAFGFALTFFPSVLTLIYCVFCFVRNGPSYGIGT